ncbi:hypothetical protein INT46_005710 [Mucor plumbeus]|uniref:HAUS augmin-like complex subunit 6 N-terminal domain-containing protein n=1 Tax=Mucor plumbeus TaxID=97098 RepID=A0A8H7UM96_9FUNG|nr:hypothetical protein INT46_005710 [Mucor plumbeus]
MPIKTLLHNLKLLGFDESKHAKGAIQLNEMLFTRGAINNDKAFEYICLFLFRRIDRNRVKRDLAPNLTIRTYGSKQNFISKVHRWLIEIRRGCDLFNRIPLPIPIFSKSTSTEIQENITQASQFFRMFEESKNAYINKASEAAIDLNNELSPSQVQDSLITSKETNQLNHDLVSIKYEFELMPNANSADKSIADHFSVDSHYTYGKDTTDIETAPSSFIESNTTSFNYAEKLNNYNLEYTATSDTQPTNINELPSFNNVARQYNPVTKKSPLHSYYTKIPSITAITNTIPRDSVPNISYSASNEIMHSSPPEPLTTNTLPVFGSMNNLSNSVAENNNASSPVYSSYTSLPNITALTHSIPHNSISDTGYISPNEIKYNTPTNPSTANLLPSFGDMNDLAEDNNVSSPIEANYSTIPSNRATVANPISQNAVPDVGFNPSYNFTNKAPYGDVTTLAPMQFSYVKEPCRLPPFRKYFLEYSLEPALESPYWILPPVYDIMSKEDNKSLLLTKHFSPDVTASTTSSRKRKLSTYEESEEDEEDEEIVVAPSPTRRKINNNDTVRTPPSQVINLNWDEQYEASPRSLENLDLVPPLMEESAPFRRIYQTEYFDIDFLTPRR